MKRNFWRVRSKRPREKGRYCPRHMTSRAASAGRRLWPGWRNNKPRSSTKSGRNARRIFRSDHRAKWSPSLRSSRRKRVRPTNGRAWPASSSTDCRNTCGSSPTRRSYMASSLVRARSGIPSPRRKSIRRLRTIPTSSTGFRRVPYPTRARRRSKRSPTRLAARICISWPTERGAMCSPTRSSNT